MFPDLGDDAPRREGTAAHEVMETILRGGVVTPGTIARNGVEITQQMIDGAWLLRQDIEEKLGANWAQMIVVEQRVNIPRIHPMQCWGTPDVYAWVRTSAERYTLYVWDLKFGFKQVEVFESEQLTAYAAGALDLYPQLSDMAVTCVLTIVQPRAYHPLGPVRSWTVAASDLRGEINILASVGEDALSPTPICTPHPEACENCLARSGCGALLEAGYRGMDIARQAVARVLPDDALGLELVMLDDAEALIKARKSGLEELVKHKLKQGVRVPHWSMGPGRGATVWIKPAAEVAAMGKLLEKDLRKPMEVMTPLQAQAAGVPESVLRVYSQSVPGATKLTRTNEKDIRRVFS